MPNELRYLLALMREPPADILTLARLWLSLARMDIRLKILPHGFNRRLLFLEPPAAGPAPDAEAPDAYNSAKILRLVRLVSIAARFPAFFDMSCLRRSLVLRSRLHAMGIPARLVYGAKRDRNASAIRAHAWLEAGGMRIDGSQEAAIALTRNEQPLLR